jgi:serine protease Do
MKHRFNLFLCLCSALAVFTLLPPSSDAKTNSPPTAAPKLIIQDKPVNRDVRAGASFSGVIKKVAPSVVNIYSTLTLRDRDRSMGNPLFDDPMFRRFFGDDFGEQRQPRERKAQSLGSGVIVSSDGYLLTANHVVEGADKVRVALASGDKEFEAKVIGTDPPTDIALLKIEGNNLPAIPVADSDKLEVGDIVLAIGNPFGVGQTVTMGIVSAIGRGGFGINDYENFIQTDAAINPGNSGGALVDAEGRLIGINTAIFSRSGGNMGVGFAVPISMARFVMDRITSEGKVARGYLGIDIQPLTPELASDFNLPADSSGVLVGGVRPDSAAEKAGLKEGDLILDINGKKISDPRNLQLLIAQTAPGSKIVIRVLRSEGGRKPVEKTVTTTLAELPQDALASRGRNSSGERNPSTMDALDGVEVTDIDSRVRRRLELPANVRGALVTNIDPDSHAAEAGLRPGDIIVEINRQPVRSGDDAVNLSKKIKGDHVLLRVWSQGAGGGGTRYVVINNPKSR